jgi:tetraacyldisaccharide 4'-kinase
MQLHYTPKLPPWGWVCLPLNWCYALVVMCRQGLYDLGLLPQVKVSILVISVGNITTGGTGKTPVVLAITKALLDAGLKVVILNRGHGASQPQSYAKATNPAFGDEAYLLQQALPKAVVIVGKNRSSNAKQAITDYQPDVIVLDDGFQHQRLYRDMDIVLIDGQRGIGNAHLLPLGPLREPIQSIQRASYVWLSKVNSPELITAQLPKYILDRVSACVPVKPLGFRPLQGNQSLIPLSKDTVCILVSGIANPDSFQAMVTQLGILALQHLIYPDHHAYTLTDANYISTQLATASPDTMLITTDKDADKLALMLPQNILLKAYSLVVTAQLPHDFVAQTLLPLIAQ